MNLRSLVFLVAKQDFIGFAIAPPGFDFLGCLLLGNLGMMWYVARYAVLIGGKVMMGNEV
ncbi:hypothetical protein [Okeania sp. SIO1I7]|uniref:hypothetical protein n=1 Tax=Okeania sp. SIO1I7 TaxID=2607772 RepID=UPI0013FA42DE|nr:hypothetical protein [Okeania sp. SIO1I7]NET25675.1 hypothetical protein [Okeania sp. SIO1I7]